MERSTRPDSSIPGQRRGETVAVVLAVGDQPRQAATTNRVFLPLHGRPIVVHALERFERSPLVDRIVLVIARGDELQYRRLVRGHYWLPKLSDVVFGGDTRAEAEHDVLQHLRRSILEGRVTNLLIHDAARPIFEPYLIDWLAEARADSLACVPGVRSRDLVARVASDGHLAEVYQPERVLVAQSPQAFDARLLLESVEAAWKAGFRGGDPAEVVEWAGHPVRVIPGDEDNARIASPDDLLYAEWLLERDGLGGVDAYGRMHAHEL